VLNDPEVSRKHARLMAQSGSYILEDLGSTNGTFVNGQRLMGPHLLRNGEAIMFGENVSVAFEAPEFDQEATLVSASGVPTAPPPSRETVVLPQEPPAPPRTVPEPWQQAPSYQAPPPVYSGQVPASPAEPYMPPAESYMPPAEPAYEIPGEAAPEKKSKRTWIYVGCGCLVILLACVVVGAFVFDSLNLYCTAPFNALFACP
jgi:pSer/pThr/pTyr-binding forkhead associated (FHA) protein